MSNPTTPFGWQMPTNTDLVTDLPADFEVFGQAVATSMQDLLGGTTGQVLSKTTNADMDFTWIANDQGDITAVTAGTGISGGGTSGAVTVTNSMATAITTSGDLIQGTGSGTFARLATGTSGQYLTTNGTTNSWVTPATSGGITLISETVASGLSSLSLGSIPNTYKDLTLTWNGIYPSGSTSSFGMRFNNNSGTVYNGLLQYSTGSNGRQVYRFNTTDNAFGSVVGSWPFGQANGIGADNLGYNAAGRLTIYNYASASKTKLYELQFFGTDSDNLALFYLVTATFNDTAAISSIDIFRNTGSNTFSNSTNTSIRLYGNS